eukprot:4702666-Karenia_brevis.AAC.1
MSWWTVLRSSQPEASCLAQSLKQHVTFCIFTPPWSGGACCMGLMHMCIIFGIVVCTPHTLDVLGVL